MTVIAEAEKYNQIEKNQQQIITNQNKTKQKGDRGKATDNQK